MTWFSRTTACFNVCSPQFCTGSHRRPALAGAHDDMPHVQSATVGGLVFDACFDSGNICRVDQLEADEFIA